LNNDYEGMLEYIYRNAYTEEEAENLLNSGRTYNYYTYHNQVDDYQQDHYQFHFSHAVQSNWNITAALHYTYGRGFYEEYKSDEAFSEYGLNDLVFSTDTISTSDLVRRKWLNNDFYGVTFSSSWTSKNHELILGGAVNEYDGKHYHELIWMEYASGTFPGQIYYTDDAVKKDGNIYIKYIWKLNDMFTFFTDHQLRSVSYSFNGLVDVNSDLLRRNERIDFYNPKAGLNAQLTGKLNSYIYIGTAGKEPNRNDYTESSATSRPDPERMIDYEAGLNFQSKKIKSSLNFYYMDYIDQLVLTGAVNDVGNYSRTNTPNSYRMGIEAELSVTPAKNLNAGLNATASQNRIKEFSEFVTNYGDGSEMEIKYSNTDIAFSPPLTGAAWISYRFLDFFVFSVNGKYISKQYLDNTSNEKRKIDPYQVVDAGITWTWKPKFIREITAGFFIYNVFDKEYVSNGYTYAYYYGGMVRENMYYPQAGINFMGKLSLMF
jgi:iron complex outermembrane recepter protein